MIYAYTRHLDIVVRRRRALNSDLHHYRSVPATPTLTGAQPLSISVPDRGGYGNCYFLGSFNGNAYDTVVIIIKGGSPPYTLYLQVPSRQAAISGATTRWQPYDAGAGVCSHAVGGFPMLLVFWCSLGVGGFPSVVALTTPAVAYVGGQTGGL